MKNLFSGVTKYLFTGVMIGCTLPVFSQKKTLDTSAYEQWRYLAVPSISYDGEWVMYHYPEGDTKYLKNTHNGKEIQLDNIGGADFFDYGKWLKYTTKKDSMILMRLKDGKRIVWDKSSYINCGTASPNVIYGNNKLVIWNVETNDSTIIEHQGKYTLYAQSIIYIRNKKLLAGPLKGKQNVLFTGDITDYSFDPEKEAGTFLSDNRLYTFSVKKGVPQQILNFNEIEAPAGYRIDARAYEITGETKAFLPDLIPLHRVEPKAAGRPANTGFDLELWTWNEPVTQRKQRRGVYNKTALDEPAFIYHIDTRKWVEVRAENTSGFLLTPDADNYNYVLQTDPKPYVYTVDWRYNNNDDIYMVNVHTGARTLIAKDCYANPQWSPDGKYAVIYNAVKKEWQVLDTATRQFVNISDQIGYPVHEEDFDMPKPAPAYGLAGWADGGSSVVMYDRYDLWVIDLSGKKKAYSVTNGYGRQHGVRFRLLSAEYNEHLDITKPLLFRSFNEHTKAKGVYRLANHKVEALVDNPVYSVKVVAMAGDGKSCVFTKENYNTYADLWWGSSDFTRQQRLTDINPQQKDYNWGTAKVVQWKNYEGKENQGILYLPENYDSTKKYPMIVDFYETHTEELHEYFTPMYSTCTINIPTYVSNGYVVFRPDVHFTVGEPGESAYNAVVSGTSAMIERGIADKAHIGLQGHSFSGYEVAYLVTRTNIFKCANPGAAVANLTYNYSAIRGNGAPCLFKYEVEQGRIGKNLWEGKDLYLKNSPIFNADKIQTPLLIFHNDKDGAVAFTQGLDLFMAMRRLAKPAWLLNYKGEGHTLDGLPAQKDWTLRMGQFFDHYLKDKPMPKWMKEGISVDERNADQKYDY